MPLRRIRWIGCGFLVSGFRCLVLGNLGSRFLALRSSSVVVRRRSSWRLGLEEQDETAEVKGARQEKRKKKKQTHDQRGTIYVASIRRGVGGRGLDVSVAG